MITFEALDVILRVQNLPGFVARMRAGANSVRMVGRAARSESASTSAAVLAAAKKASAGLAMVTAAAAVTGYHQSVNFEREMTLIQTQAGRTREEVAAMTPEVLALAKTTGQLPVELSKGLFGLASTGMPTSELLDSLKIAADGAAVGLADVEDTTNALVGAWLANIEGAGGFEQTMGILNATVGAGNLRMQDLVTAMGTGVLPAAKNFGLSIQDVMGALALLTDEGYGAYGAMAQFATALHFIGAPTEKARKAMEAMGLDALEIGTVMREQGMIPALRMLQDAITSFSTDPEVQTDMLAKILPGGRGRVIVTLMNQLDRYQQKLDQINGTSDDFDAAVKRTHETSAFKLKQAWANINVALIEFGDTFREEATPILVDLLGLLEGMVKALSWIVKHFNDLLPVIGPVAAAFIAYKLAVMGAAIWTSVLAGIGAVAFFIELGMAIGFVNAMMLLITVNPVFLVIAAVVALIAFVYLAYKHWGWFRHAAQAAWKWTKNAAIDTWQWLKSHIGPWIMMNVHFWMWLGRTALRVWGWIKNAAVDAFNYIKDSDSIQLMITGFRIAGRIIRRVAHGIKNAFMDAFNWIKDNAGSVKDAVLKYTPVGLWNRAAKIVGLPHAAMGVSNFIGGPLVVGEHGPEVINLPRGSSVIPNHKAFATASTGVHSTQPGSPPSSVGRKHDGDDREPFVVELDGEPIYRGVAKRRANKKARK